MTGSVGKVNRDLFFKVASDLEKERVQAAMQLINEISSVGVDDAGLAEWEYVLGRLVKGLSSNRGGARLGFSMCLTEVLAMALDRQEVFASIDGFYELLDKTYGIDNGLKNGKEERGVLFAQMFALQAILNEPVMSKVFYEKQTLNLDRLIDYLHRLIQLALCKTWIREPCLYSMFQAVEKCSEWLQEHLDAVKRILALLDEYKLTLTNEGLSIYLLFNPHLHQLGPDFVPCNAGWKNNDPLSKGNVNLLASTLKDVLPVEKSDLKQKGSWSPRLHYVWDVLLPLLESGEQNTDEMDRHVSKKRKKNSKKSMNTDQRARIQFPEFWQAVVDESFFNEKASSERKYLGFLILEKAVKICSATHIKVLLSQNLLRCIINQSQDSQRMLNKITSQVLKSIVAECEVSPAKVTPLIDVVWFGKQGSINFDKLIKNKFTDSLISVSSLQEEHLVELVSLLINHLPTDFGSNEDANLTRFIFDSLLHIVRAHKSLTNPTWIKPILSSVIIAAFFNESATDKFREMAKERLYSILGELMNVPKKVDQETPSWPYITLNLIFEQETSGLSLSVNLDPELKTVKETAVKALSKIHNTNIKDSNSKLSGLELLMSMVILQLYAGDEESVSIIQDLLSFYEELNEKSTDLVGITEILLALMAQRKSLLKRLSLQVWESFVPEIGEKELDVLLPTLTARENKQGFASLFEGDEDDEDQEDVEEGEDEEAESDSEVESDSDSEVESDSNSEDENNSEVEHDNDLQKIEKEAASALAKALNLPDSIVGDDGEVQFGSDDMEESSQEESMDDEAMIELDGQLSEIFKRRKEALSSVPTGSKRKVEVQESRENVISFKHRVMDMLEVYVKSFDHMTDNTSESNVLEKKLSDVVKIVLVVLQCLQITLDKSLADKCSKLIKLRINKLKLLTNTGTKAAFLLKSLRSVHSLLLTSKPGQYQQLFFSTSSVASLYLSKNYIASGGSYDDLIDLYASTSKSWVKDGKFTVNFFIDFYNWLMTKKSLD